MSREPKNFVTCFPRISYLVSIFIIMSSGRGCSCTLFIFLYSVTLLHLSLIDCLINHTIWDMGTRFFADVNLCHVPPIVQLYHVGGAILMCLG